MEVESRVNKTKIYAFATNPMVVIASLVAGLACGAWFPATSLGLAAISDVYIDLLKMIALPFMGSAVIVSLHRLFKEGSARGLATKAALAFATFSLAAAALGAGVFAVWRPGEGLSDEAMSVLSQTVATKEIPAGASAPATPKAVNAAETIKSLVPSNVFESLAKGETVRVLVFTLLLGCALGCMPGPTNSPLVQSLESLSQACQHLMRWLSYPLPVIVFCISAAQTAQTGPAPLRAMIQFVLGFALAASLLLALAVAIVWRRSGLPLPQAVRALREPFSMALATRNSVACMPSMIECLAGKLGFSRPKVELMVPLSVSLLRIGPVIYYVCATMFIAQISGRTLGLAEMAIVIGASVLAGFASAGMTGPLVVALVGMCCGYLGLPFESMLVLLLAIDPICDMFRTLVLVLGNSAAVAMVCDPPPPTTPEPAACVGKEPEAA